MVDLMLLILGAALSVLGIMNIKGNINTVHAYNRRKVKTEHIPKYGKVVGAGTLIAGLSLVASFFILSYWDESVLPFVLIPSLTIGLGLILYGQFKYNRGIF